MKKTRKMLLREEAIEEFIKFIKAKDLYEDFRSLLLNHYGVIGRQPSLADALNSFLWSAYPENFVSSAFTWDSTEQGHDFWWKIDNEWRQHLAKLQGEA